jgi:integrase
MGSILRAMKKGRFVGWYVQYRDLDGKLKHRASHQPTKELARRYLLQLEGRIARGQIGIPERAAPAPTVAELCDRFLVEYSRPKIKDLKRYRMTARTALRRALPYLGKLRADAVTELQIIRLREALLSKYAANSARVTLAHLGAAFSFATKLGILAKNPLRGVELPRRVESIEYLIEDEMTALLAAARNRAAASGKLSDRMLHTCILFALHTGLRKGELFALRWGQDLDLKTKRLTVARSFAGLPKGGKVRQLKLPDAVIPALTEWAQLCPKTAEGLIFPVLSCVPRMAKAHERLELDRLIEEVTGRRMLRPWHCLRHSFASQYVLSGGNILALQRILGHADLKMTLVYSHLAPDYLGEEMNRLRLKLH